MTTYDFTAGQGETFDRTVTWKIDDVAVNLTGCYQLADLPSGEL